MEDTSTTTTTATDGDWREAWRAFADQLRPKPADGHTQPAPVAVRVKSDETEGGTFRGFESPPGKF